MTHEQLDAWLDDFSVLVTNNHWGIEATGALVEPLVDDLAPGFGEGDGEVRTHATTIHYSINDTVTDAARDGAMARVTNDTEVVVLHKVTKENGNLYNRVRTTNPSFACQLNVDDHMQPSYNFAQGNVKVRGPHVRWALSGMDIAPCMVLKVFDTRKTLTHALGTIKFH